MARKIRTIAVDFDGTLCDSIYPGIGVPHVRRINELRTLRTIGVKLILWTCRTGVRLQEAIDWCKQFGLEFDAVNENLPERILEFGTDPRKIGADMYLDDLAYNPVDLFDEKQNLYEKLTHDAYQLKLKKLLNHKILTVREVAKRAYCSSSTVYTFVREGINPTAAVFEHLKILVDQYDA